MLDRIEFIARHLGIAPEYLMSAGIALGLLLVTWGVYASFVRPDPALSRLEALSRSRRQQRQDRQLLLTPDRTPGGFMRAFEPGSRSERSDLRAKLEMAGLRGAHALRLYTLVRVLLGIGLPGGFLTLLALARTPGVALPFGLSERMLGLSGIGIYQYLVICVGVGYFAPTYWLNARVAARKLRIEESFPTALDLLQISIEAGLGFDMAMTRVGNEIMRSAPDLASEFLTVQHQVAAGRMRDVAMRDMAERTGLETVRSFSNVVQQSMRFGTPMGQALTTYAEELRNMREMRAQEKANKLPVKMSAVLASLMLPALIILTVGPVFIRYVNQF